VRDMSEPNETMKRLRGLRALVEQAVEHGSKAVEKVHRATANRTFDVLESIEPIATPVKVVHTFHDLSVGATYGAIRLVNKVVGKTLDVAIDVADAPSDEDKTT
jgi:hypothetical protein